MERLLLSYGYWEHSQLAKKLLQDDVRITDNPEAFMESFDGEIRSDIGLEEFYGARLRWHSPIQHHAVHGLVAGRLSREIPFTDTRLSWLPRYSARLILQNPRGLYTLVDFTTPRKVFTYMKKAFCEQTPRPLMGIDALVESGMIEPLEGMSPLIVRRARDRRRRSKVTEPGEATIIYPAAFNEKEK